MRYRWRHDTSHVPQTACEWGRGPAEWSGVTAGDAARRFQSVGTVLLLIGASMANPRSTCRRFDDGEIVVTSSSKCDPQISCIAMHNDRGHFISEDAVNGGYRTLRVAGGDSSALSRGKVMFLVGRVCPGFLYHFVSRNSGVAVP